MEKAFWLERWQTGQIGFHQSRANALLDAHWLELGVAETASVFVPLCGKSLDMHFLRKRGHPVLGVELSRTAAEAFFEEAKLAPVIEERGAFTVFESEGYRLLCGDFFALTSADLAPVGAVYDRAALIALPPEIRRAYVRALTERLPERVSMLLVTFEYDQGRTHGPPFAVLEGEVRTLYGPAFDVELLERVPASISASRFEDLGPGAIHEAAYRIRRGSFR